MSKSANQKLKLLYILRLFREKTDSEHFVTMTDIIKYLEGCGVSAERKSVYTDIEALRLFGYDIRGEKSGGRYKYKLISREFEPTELKLLIDAVQSSRSVTEEMSRELISKLERFTSTYNAKRLHKTVIVKNRVKSINGDLYRTMDSVNEAMALDRRICFEYLQWNLRRELVPKKDPLKADISPWAFIWDNECYYLLAYDPAADKLKHYRLDKMTRVKISSDEGRDGREMFEKIDLAVYSRERFGMFSGEALLVRLECKNSAANYIIDKFGTDIMLVPKDEQSFTVNVEVVPNKMFFGWIMGLGGDVRIISPKSVRKEMRERIKDAARLYRKE